MKQKITISTHNGSKFSLAHNFRDAYVVARENEKWAEKHPDELRIDPNGEYIIFKKENLRAAYHELFEEARIKYNEKQIKNGHKDRVINDYLSLIQAKEHTSKSAQHPAYEIIYAIGSKENPVPEEISKAILTEVANNFEKRNPNLHVICCVLHADEPSGVIHLHITYIPYANHCTRGMEVQNGIKAALRAQGIEGDSHFNTAQIKWERIENNYLERLTNQYGYEVIHPQRGTKQEHLSIEEYKLKKEIENHQAELAKFKELLGGNVIIKKARLTQLENIESDFKEYKADIDSVSRDKQAYKDAFEAYNAAFKKLEKDREDFNHKVNEAANNKAKEIIDNIMDFLHLNGLYEKYVSWQDSQIEAMRKNLHIK